MELMRRSFFADYFFRWLSHALDGGWAGWSRRNARCSRRQRALGPPLARQDQRACGREKDNAAAILGDRRKNQNTKDAGLYVILGAFI